MKRTASRKRGNKYIFACQFFQLFFKGDFLNVSVASRISYNDFVFVYVFKFPVLVVILSFLFGILHKLHDSQSSVNA
jgi:hypothetical protein